MGEGSYLMNLTLHISWVWVAVQVVADVVLVILGTRVERRRNAEALIAMDDESFDDWVATLQEIRKEARESPEDGVDGDD